MPITGSTRPTTDRRAARPGGFTLVELITVLVIVSVMAAVAVPTLSSLATTRNRLAARMMFKDLTYARERAIATGSNHYIVFAPAAETYTILAENPATPGRANAPIITEPSSGRSFVRTLGAGDTVGVDIVSAVFDGASEIGFDWKGRPLNSTQTFLAAQGTVTLSGGCLVQVSPGAGLITATIP